MVRLWRLYQGGGMGIGHLPDSGGTLDQPVIMMQAFALMSDFEHRLTTGVNGAPPVPLTEDDEIDQPEVNRRVAASLGVHLK